MSKIWVVSFPRCGTSSTCKALGMLGYSVVHNPLNWQDVDGFDAAGDAWIAAHWLELLNTYPDSRFIFVHRPADEWYQSLRHCYGLWTGTDTYNQVIRKTLFRSDTWEDLNAGVIMAQLKRDLFHFIPANQLLMLPLRDLGWSRLCNFLKKRQPDDPFPHTNKGHADDAGFRISRNES